MGLRHMVPLACAVVLGLSLGAGPGRAQEAKRPLPANPLGADAGWKPKVSREPGGPEELTRAQLALIKKIDLYFNELPDIQGAFVQTNADNKRIRGKFYMKRPGRFRFDYNPRNTLPAANRQTGE